MKRLCLLLIVLAGGCFHPGQEKLKPPEGMKPPKASVRPITPDMISAENPHKAAEQLSAELDREMNK